MFITSLNQLIRSIWTRTIPWNNKLSDDTVVVQFGLAVRTKTKKTEKQGAKEQSNFETIASFIQAVKPGIFQYNPTITFVTTYQYIYHYKTSDLLVNLTNLETSHRWYIYLGWLDFLGLGSVQNFCFTLSNS